MIGAMSKLRFLRALPLQITALPESIRVLVPAGSGGKLQREPR